MAQVEQPQQNPFFVGTNMRLSSKQETPLSVYPTNSFGTYNPMLTPSATSSYGCMSWSGMNSMSPSIWSQNHLGNTQWPSASHIKPNSMNTVNNGSYYPRNTVPPYPYVSNSIQPQPINSGGAQVPQVMLVSQNTAILPSQQVVTHPLMQLIPQGMHPSQVQPVYAPMQVSVQPIQPNYYPQFYPSAPQLPSTHYISGPGQDLSDEDSYNTEYDVQLASKFIVTAASSMCQGIIIADEEIPSLELYVRTLIHATRLSKATLLISLVILNRAIEAGIRTCQNFTLKYLLIGAFVLANKINDDNTFTNASWSMVVGFPTKQVTSLELSFLHVLSWCFNLDDKNIAEWKYWENCWREFEINSQKLYPPLSPGIWSQNYGIDSLAVAAC